ncbi:MAG: chemotaxis protein CheW [Chloroflexota bacterium]|nr:MAG: chemotaxis protein CheW [Chloroflexota bacterium]
MTETTAPGLYLLCRVRGALCALPLEHVVETMRPLPVEPLAGTPPFVRGVSIIRGVPLPVVDAALLVNAQHDDPARFVTLRVGGRQVALAVNEVVGVRAIKPEGFHDLPPLLREVAADVITSIGALDHELLLTLQSARLVPDSVWATVEAVGSAS